MSMNPEDNALPLVERTARRNCYLSWAIGKAKVLEEEINWCAYFNARSSRVTDVQAAAAIETADRLERMAADLRAIGRKRLELVDAA